MIWIAPSEKDADSAALEKRLWDAAEQAGPAFHFAESEYHSARPEGLLSLLFLPFAEARLAAQRARWKAACNMPDRNNHHDHHHERNA